jgi:hypothetical protein
LTTFVVWSFCSAFTVFTYFLFLRGARLRLQAADHIYTLTVAFTLLVVIAATQGKGLYVEHPSRYRSDLPFLDIAVDGKLSPRLPVVSALNEAGWSLTLLSRENLSYASTCQTVGLTIGGLMSFTVFLALNSEAFR